MKEKIFLTSFIAMGFVAPAFAEPSHTGTFPNDGYMEEDYTYTNAATSTNMDGVYSGTVDAVAEYDVIDYILTAGKYLPADSETITTCPAGSFCAGGTTVQYNQSSAQGIQTCPSGFGSSADGSSSNTQCYRACDINNVGDSVTAIAHATAISGNDYYGSGVDTCEPTACENGWHVKAGVNGSAIASKIGTGIGASRAWVNNNGQFKEDGTSSAQSFYGLTDNNTWAVYYDNTRGMLTGQGRCSTVQGIRDFNDSTEQLNQPLTTHTTSELGAEGGQYCYCNVTGYKGTNGNTQSLSSPWVFNQVYGDASKCANACAAICAAGMRNNIPNPLAFRATVLGSVESSPAMCEANVININWNDVDPATAGQNNENTAVYGSDVRTPVKAQTKKGKTFKGWRFSKPQQTNL